MFLICFGILFVSCSTLPNSTVLRTDEGRLLAMGTDWNEAIAIIAAVEEANSFCSNRNRYPIFEGEFLRSLTKKRKNSGVPEDPFNLSAFSRVEPKVFLEFRCA